LGAKKKKDVRSPKIGVRRKGKDEKEEDEHILNRCEDWGKKKRHGGWD